jgi:hypothetical protein
VKILETQLLLNTYDTVKFLEAIGFTVDLNTMSTTDDDRIEENKYNEKFKMWK